MAVKNWKVELGVFTIQTIMGNWILAALLQTHLWDESSSRI
jgi:hypothetical protein